MAGGRRAGRGFLLHPVRPAVVTPQGGGGIAVTGETALSLEWSFTLAGNIAVSTVTTNDDDAWTIPLEWSFLVDLDPADDVED